jgi:hypothetical protein
MALDRRALASNRSCRSLSGESIPHIDSNQYQASKILDCALVTHAWASENCSWSPCRRAGQVRLWHPVAAAALPLQIDLDQKVTGECFAEYAQTTNPRKTP